MARQLLITLVTFLTVYSVLSKLNLRSLGEEVKQKFGRDNEFKKDELKIKTNDFVKGLILGASDVSIENNQCLKKTVESKTAVETYIKDITKDLKSRNFNKVFSGLAKVIAGIVHANNEQYCHFKELLKKLTNKNDIERAIAKVTTNLFKVISICAQAQKFFKSKDVLTGGKKVGELFSLIFNYHTQ